MAQSSDNTKIGMSKLDRLNVLLARNAKAFGLPDHRAKVHTSGSNQQWLVSALQKHEGGDREEIVALLGLPIKRLLKESYEDESGV